MQQIQVKDFATLSASLGIRQRGNYLRCTCPQCGKREAYMWGDNLNFINCSRQNNCGITTHVIYDNASDMPIIEAKERTSTKTNDEAIQKQCDDVFKGGLDCIDAKDFGFPEEEAGVRYLTETRGISFDTLKKAGVMVSFGLFTLPVMADYLHGHVDSFDKNKFAFRDEYFERYNIIFAITNDVTGRYERLIFRSTKNVKLKELQFKLYDNAQKHVLIVRDPKELKIAICESVIDGLSLVEMGWTGSVLCAMGANTVVSAVREFDCTKYNDVVIALDNDEAGQKFAHKVQQVLPNARMIMSEAYSKYKDFNEMLLKTKGVI